MKTIRVATLNAGKFNTMFSYLTNWQTLFVIGLWLIISCSNSEDFEGLDNNSVIDKEPPAQNEPPVDDGAPVEEEPTVDEEPVIIYTDIEPDFKSENKILNYDIDLNDDNIIDFSITFNSDGSYEWLGIASDNPNNGILSLAPWYTHPMPLDLDAKIFIGGFNNGEFYAPGAIFNIDECFGGESGCYLDWMHKGEKYLGLRFLIDGKFHYGWIRIEIISATEWIVKDFAYNATPKKPILAGQLK
ncbi:hypothetical protein G3I01_11585 [Gramella sp. MT6]|uniref:hypothetical protein n=1 Tax=Gramella sp. MT6 TaxID=2705471 RepID=UPI001C5E93F1|nr:hypothetical protein [Gramella sp. MT6]QYA26129.1 hypothetical protein G3I01_11585 [Gramella sp. MT6]